jgi:hypothetical protein
MYIKVYSQNKTKVYKKYWQECDDTDEL